MPTLMPGLLAVADLRPENPPQFLATFLLKNNPHKAPPKEEVKEEAEEEAA